MTYPARQVNGPINIKSLLLLLLLLLLNNSDRKQHLISFSTFPAPQTNTIPILVHKLLWQLVARAWGRQTDTNTHKIWDRSFLLKFTYTRRRSDSNKLIVMRQYTDQFLCVISTCIIFHRIKFVRYIFKVPVIAMFVIFKSWSNI